MTGRGPYHPRQARAALGVLLALLVVSGARWAVRPPLRERGELRPRRVAINRADSIEIELLPGVGPALARRIVRTRAERGRFERPEHLRRVPGVGPVLQGRIARHARLD